MLATFTVTSLLDNTTPDDGFTTLREAVLAANLNGDADTIQFASNLTGDLNLLSISDVGVGASALAVTSPITIQGNTNGITIRRDAAASEMRLFRITATGSLTLEMLTLANGVGRGTSGTAGTPNGGDGRGGAIFNQGSLLIRGSTLLDNRAVGGNGFVGGAGAGGAGLGGAVYNDGASVTVINSTFSGNSSEAGAGTPTGGSFAAGIYSRNGTISIYNSTLTNNSATVGRGVYVLGEGATATATVHSTIIGQDDTTLASEFAAVVGDAPGSGSNVTGLNNLIRSYNGAAADFANKVAPLLQPLANNGGPTRTHAFQSESWASNNGSNLQNLATDQRGSTFARVGNGAVDIGAYEHQSTGSGFFAGDYNGNQVVDAADYVAWRNTLGDFIAAYSGADGNGSGQVDPGDYTVWRAHFGSSSQGVGAVEIDATSGVLAPSDLSDVEVSGVIDLTAHSAAPVMTLSAAITPSRDVKRDVFSFASIDMAARQANDLALLNIVNSKRVWSVASISRNSCRYPEIGLGQPKDVASVCFNMDELWDGWPANYDVF